MMKKRYELILSETEVGRALIALTEVGITEIKTRKLSLSEKMDSKFDLEKKWIEVSYLATEEQEDDVLFDFDDMDNDD